MNQHSTGKGKVRKKDSQERAPLQKPRKGNNWKEGKRPEKEPLDLLRTNGYRIQIKRRSGKEKTDFKDLGWQ